MIILQQFVYKRFHISVGYPNRKCDQFVQNGIKDMVRESKNMLRLIGVFQKGFNTA